MTIKPLCSYFLYFTGSESDSNAFAALLNEACNGIFDVPETTRENEYLFQLIDGTTNQIDNVQEIFAKIMNRFTHCELKIKETCEEPSCPCAKYVYTNGALTTTVYGRTIDPGQYDSVTAHEYMTRFNKHMFTHYNTARAVSPDFCPHCGIAIDTDGINNFCKICGTPLTEKAHQRQKEHVMKAHADTLSEMRILTNKTTL